MRNISKLILISLSTVAFATASTSRAQEGSFSGPRAEVITGIDWTDNAPGSGASTGALFGGRLGYDFDLGSIVVGAEGEIAGSSSSQQFATFRSETDRYISGAVRVGYKPSDSILLFARGGYGNARINFTPSTPALGGNFDGSGFQIGGGGEVIFGGQFFARAEYRFSNYGSGLRGQQSIVGLGIRF